MFKVAPLHSSLMLFSMIGFILSAFFLNHELLKNWAWSFMIVFVIMFIAALISMGQMPLDKPEHLKRLAIHEKGHHSNKKK